MCFSGRVQKHWIGTPRKIKESRVFPNYGRKELGDIKKAVEDQEWN